MFLYILHIRHAMKPTVKVGQWTYAINKNIKEYALRDAGFIKTLRGNYRYTHPLYLDSPYDTIGILKIDINESLTELEILTTILTTGNDQMTKINLFKNDKLKPVVDLLKFNLDDLVDREILKQVK